MALFYPCDELLCWDTAGNRAGTWTEISCDGHDYSGTWTGYVTDDCRFIGTDEWESVSGLIDPITAILTAEGTIRDACGSTTMSGNFTDNLTSVAGNYIHDKGGGGFFSGRIRH